MEWRTSAILAFLLWVEGLRRVPAGALVLRRLLAGPWRAGALAPNGGPSAVAWWPPLTLSLVVPPADGPDGDAVAARLASRLGRALPLVGVLRVLAGAALLALVVGVPVAARRYGAYGLLAGVAGLLALTLACATVAFVAFRRLGAGRAAAVRLGAPLAWPISAPSAPERLLAYAVAGAPPVAVAAALLPAAHFARWVRPFAYDALTGVPPAGHLAAPPDFADALRSLLGVDALAACVAA
jgi:hypothetical protein